MSLPTKDKRKTQQQMLIRGLFQHTERPLSAQELFEAVAPIQPSIGIATVYRGIKSLLEEGFIAPVEIPGTSPRYERTSAHHHHHFLCQKCDRVFAVAGCPGQLEKIVPPGFKLASHRIILEGSCVSCGV